jgi:hypothetical protein
MAKEPIYPQSLVNLYIKLHDNNWEDEDTYLKFKVEAIEYIGKPKGKVQYPEAHMICILISQLASAYVRGNIKSSI